MKIAALQGYGPKTPLAVHEGRPVSQSQFAADVTATAATMPECGNVINLAKQRYPFLVGFFAAMLRQRPTLLPVNETPGALRKLATAYPGCCLFADDDYSALAHLPRHRPQTGNDKAAELPEWKAEQIAAVVFTSGSTGEPQAHRKSWGSLLGGARNTGKRLGLEKLAGRRLIATVPSQHMYGLENAIILPLQFGLTLVSERPFYPADVTATLADCQQLPVLISTPVHLKFLLRETPSYPPAALLISSTAYLDTELAGRAEARFGATLVEIYGSSETGVIATRRTTEEDSWLPLDGIQVEQHADGILVRAEYLDDAVFLADRLDLLASGRFRILGRQADMIKIAGKRASLRALEHIILSVEGVSDAAFLLYRGPNTAERMIAFAAAPEDIRQAINNALRANCDPVFMPRHLILLDKLPRNESGKLPRSVLVDMLHRHHGECGIRDDPPAEHEIMISADHPALEGHFPGQPIVPAVLILERILQIGRQQFPSRQFKGIARAKFHRPLQPGQRGQLTLSAQDDGIHFLVEQDDKPITSGLISEGKDSA